MRNRSPPRHITIKKRKEKEKNKHKNKVWHTNIHTHTTKNTYWRKVIFTGRNLQVVLMSIPPQSELGWEIHKNTDQFFRIEKGKGALLTRSTPSGTINTIDLNHDIAATVPQNIFHNVVNTSKRIPLQLYTIYAPPHHPPNRIDKTKHAELLREHKI